MQVQNATFGESINLSDYRAASFSEGAAPVGAPSSASGLAACEPRVAGQIERGSLVESVALRRPSGTQCDNLTRVQSVRPHEGKVHEVHSDSALETRTSHSAAAGMHRSLSAPNLFGVIQSDALATSFVDALSDTINQLSEDSQRGGISQSVFLDALAENFTQKFSDDDPVAPYLGTLLPIAKSFVADQYGTARRSGWGRSGWEGLRRSWQNLTALLGKPGNGSASQESRRLSLMKLHTEVGKLREDSKPVQHYFFRHSALVRLPGQASGRKRVTFAPNPQLAQAVNSLPQGSLALAQRALDMTAAKCAAQGDSRAKGLWPQLFEESIDAAASDQSLPELSPLTPGFVESFAQWVDSTPKLNKLSLTEFRNRLPSLLYKFEVAVDWSDGQKKSAAKDPDLRIERVRARRRSERVNKPYGGLYSVEFRLHNYHDIAKADEERGIPPLCPEVVANYFQQAKTKPLHDGLAKAQAAGDSAAVADYERKLEQETRALTPALMVERFPKLFDPKSLPA